MDAPDESQQTGPAGERAGFDILLIEDDADIRNVLSIALQRSGYTLCCAPEGKTGMRLLAQHRFRLVITDIYMPDMDGIEVIMRNAALTPEMPILAISGGSKRGGCELRTAKALRCRKTLAKPFSLKELLSAAAELIGRPVTPELQPAGKP